MLNKRLILFFIFIIIVFGLLSFQGGRKDSKILDLPLYPLTWLEEGITAVYRDLRDIFNKYILIVGIYDENQKLRRKLNELQMELSQLKEIENEVKRLRKLLELKSQRNDVVAIARVIGRDPTNWFQVIWIDKGSQDGIEKDMIAITPDGLAGRVRKVLKDTASIILITDVNSSVAVRMQNSRIEGIIEGDGKDTCYVKYIPRDAVIRVGDRVITSGVDMVYPRGIVVGSVSEVFYREGDLFLTVKVRPSVDLRAIEEVVILKK